MKYILFIIFSLLTLNIYSQTYNAAQAGVAVNKPLGVAQAVPTDARSWFYSTGSLTHSKYTGTSQILSYLNTSTKRGGNFFAWASIGGIDKPFMFRNGVADGNLVEIILDSPIDTLNRNNAIYAAINATTEETAVTYTTSTSGSLPDASKVVFLSGASGAVVYTISPTTFNKKTLKIYCTNDANLVSITASSGNIGGFTTVDITVGQAITLYSNGTNFIIL